MSAITGLFLVNLCIKIYVFSVSISSAHPCILVLVFCLFVHLSVYVCKRSLLLLFFSNEGGCVGSIIPTV